MTTSKKSSLVMRTEGFQKNIDMIHFLKVSRILLGVMWKDIDLYSTIFSANWRRKGDQNEFGKVI